MAPAGLSWCGAGEAGGRSSFEVGTRAEQSRRARAVLERDVIVIRSLIVPRDIIETITEPEAAKKELHVPVSVQFVSIGCFSLSLVLATPTVTSLFLQFFNIYSHVLDFREMRNERQDHGEYAKQDEAGKEQAHRYSDPSFCPHGCEI